MPISQQQRKEFEDKGFIVIKGFFDRNTVDKLSAWFDRLRKDNSPDCKEAKYYEQSPVTGENVLVRVEHVLGDHDPEITRLLLSPRTIECVTALLGEAPVLFKEKINYKLPGCRADKLHQDQAAGWNAYCPFFISMGIAVDEHRRDNAALSFMCSGNYDRKLMGEEWKPLTEDDPPYKPENEYALLEADPGDVIFFDSYVPHGSPPNTGNRSRRTLFLTFNKQSDGDWRTRYYRDKWAKYPPNDVTHARSASTYRV